MDRFYFIFCVLLLGSCRNKSKVENTGTVFSDEKTQIVKEKLDIKLVEGIFKLIETNYHAEFQDIPLKESFIAIIFIIDSENAKVNFSDSIVNINYNVFHSYNNIKDYKGYWILMDIM